MQPYYQDDTATLHLGDALRIGRQLESESVNCIVTSPPYFGLRDYGEPGQYGLEESPAEYVETMRTLFAELHRVLADDGTLWLNLGDSYNAYNGNRGESRTGFSRNEPMPSLPRGAGLTTNTLPAKSLLGMPWRVALALQNDGWILRNDVIWSKPNGMPESITDRLSKRHEHVFMFAKSPRYWFDLDAIREDPTTATPFKHWTERKHDQSFLPASKQQEHGVKGRVSGVAGYNPKGRNPGDVWTIPPQPFPGAHFAVMPLALAERCIQAGCKPDGTVLDPFSGSGTTGLAAARHGRRYVGIDLSREYLDLSLRTRLSEPTLDFGSAV
jgi:site-specific DNA-methyltransferase (cytosine-N4-specific)